ncbi:MAG: Rieske (2Fe-2S) protein [Bacteroidota bacterium]
MFRFRRFSLKLPDSKQASRRDFLSKLFAGGGLMASVILAVRHTAAFVIPEQKPPLRRKLLVGRVGELKPGEAKELVIGGRALFLVHTSVGFKVFSSVCTHLGCTIKWEPHRDRFYCPCHAGVFDREGVVVSGPPPRPLDHYPVEIQDSLVYMWIDDQPQRGIA